MLRSTALLGEKRLPGFKDEALRRFEAAIDKQRADERFDDIPDDIVALCRAVLTRLLAEPHHLWNAEFAPDIGAGLARDEHVVAARQIAFGLFEVPVVKRARHDMAEHPVAEKLEPFVIFALAEALVAERQLEQAEVLGLMAQPVADESGDITHSASPV